MHFATAVGGLARAIFFRFSRKSGAFPFALRLRAALGGGKGIFLRKLHRHSNFPFPWRGIEFPVSARRMGRCRWRKILILAFFAISEENDEKLRELLVVNINYEQWSK